MTISSHNKMNSSDQLINGLCFPATFVYFLRKMGPKCFYWPGLGDIWWVIFFRDEIDTIFIHPIDDFFGIVSWSQVWPEYIVAIRMIFSQKFGQNWLDALIQIVISIHWDRLSTNYEWSWASSLWDGYPEQNFGRIFLLRFIFNWGRRLLDIISVKSWVCRIFVVLKAKIFFVIHNDCAAAD